jgi:hypothetical protein
MVIIKGGGNRMTKYVYLGPAKNNPHTELSLSYQDTLWIGRAFVGEHGGLRTDPMAFSTFAWSMINRFLLHPGNRHWRSFRYMLRRFSQPVNPRWYRDGDLAKKHAGSPMCTEARFKRREEIEALDWDDFSPGLQAGIYRLQRGELPIPMLSHWPDGSWKRPSNFAATSDKLRRKYPHGVDVEGNWYFEDSRLRKGTVAVDMWR